MGEHNNAHLNSNVGRPDYRKAFIPIEYGAEGVTTSFTDI